MKPSPDPDLMLQRLCATPSRLFGERLLALAEDGAVTFQEFLRVARELVLHVPDQAAIWLAALVALDMRRDQQVRVEPRGDPPFWRSRN